LWWPAEQAFKEVMTLKVAREKSEVSVKDVGGANAGSEKFETARRYREATIRFERMALVEKVRKCPVLGPNHLNEGADVLMM
jgi:hypothetical protein